MNEEREKLAVRLAFLQRYLEDRTHARSVPLADYQADYPGFEALIGEEYDDLVERGVAGSRYQRREEVGRGGMGIVYRVRDESLGRDLAMKVLADRVGEDAAARARRRFLDEACVTGRLQHPGVVAVHELGVDDRGFPFYTMPLIDGESFSRVIACVHDLADEWSMARAVDVLIRVCEVMAYAHSRGIVHRDLKPANVMIGRFGEVHVLDWGLARVLSEDEAREPRTEESADFGLHTIDGDVLGTPSYMAPEQAGGKLDEIGPATDVYALGAMLYHLLVGRAPYEIEGISLTSHTVIAQVLEGPPAPLTAPAPAELIAVCEHAMARAPADRYASAEALRADLQAFRDARVVSAYEDGAWAEARKWVRRNRLAASAMAVAVLALVGGLTFSLIERDRADTEAQNASAHAQRADTSSRLAQRAVQEMLTQVAGESLLWAPHLLPLRRSLFERARDFELEFLRLRGSDPTAKEDVVRAHMALATAHRQLGESQLALEQLHAARAHLDELIADSPTRSDLRTTRADVLIRMGAEHGRLDSPGEYEARLREALAALDEVRKENSRDRTARSFQARALAELATCLSNLGRHDEAKEPHAAAIELYRELHRESPADGELISRLANALTNAGTAAYKRSGPVAAERLAAEAMETLQRIRADEHTPGTRHRLAASHHLLAAVQIARGSYVDAEQNEREAVAIRRKLVHDYPSVPVFRRELAGNIHGLGLALQKTDPAAALELFKEAYTEQLRALEGNPRDPRARIYARNHVHLICETLIAQGRHGDCAEWVQKTEPVALTRPTAAKHLARCAGLAARDDTMADEERRQLTNRYVQQALGVLRKAVDAGFREAAVLKDPAFDALRDDAAFAELLARIRNGGQ